MNLVLLILAPLISFDSVFVLDHGPGHSGGSGGSGGVRSGGPLDVSDIPEGVLQRLLRRVLQGSICEFCPF